MIKKHLPMMIALFLSASFLLICSSATALGWTCSKCHVYNAGNYCYRCGDGYNWEVIG